MVLHDITSLKEGTRHSFFYCFLAEDRLLNQKGVTLQAERDGRTAELFRPKAVLIFPLNEYKWRLVNVRRNILKK